VADPHPGDHPTDHEHVGEELAGEATGAVGVRLHEGVIPAAGVE
jgi:hypothetical protein